MSGEGKKGSLETEELKQRFARMYREEARLPKEMEGKITIVSCLAWQEKRQVYLVREEGGRMSVLKVVQGEQLTFLREEAKNLKNRHFPFLPSFYQWAEEEDWGWLLREYISGDTLWERVERDGPFEETQAAEILRCLCEMAGTLHDCTPPVIHRDIKPQNIVLSEEGKLFFIDVGTMREYKLEAEHDTVFIGTRVTAPPEQYGFGQTDCRTDIYALGIVYRYLLTGSMTGKKSRTMEEIPEPQQCIIKRCTCLDPEKRYQNCRELKRELEKAGQEEAVRGKKKNRRRRRACLAGACLAVILAAGAYVIPEHLPYKFQSDLIEEAVRKELGKTEGQRITRKDLEQVETIRICGSRILETGDSHNQYMCSHTINMEETPNETEGNITDLSDIARMKNLHTLILDGQQITDLSGLSGLPIRELSLSGNPLSNVKVLETLTELERLYLEETNVSDLTAVSGLPELKFLDIAGGGTEKIAPLEGSSLEGLEIWVISQEDYETLRQLPLTHLAVHSWSARLEEVIGEMDSLKELTIYAYQHSDLKPLEGLSDLVHLDLYGSGLQTLEGIGHFPWLTSLVIGETEVEDLSPAASLEFLQRLGLENSRILDFAPLKEMKNLRWLGCDEVQMEEIQKTIDEPWFETKLYERTGG